MSLATDRAQKRLEAKMNRYGEHLDRNPDDERVELKWLNVCIAVALLKIAAAPPMVTTRQYAQSLGVSPETVRDYVKTGRLEPAAKFGRRGGYRFRPDQKPAGKSP